MTPTRHPRRLRPEARRELILEAARRCIADKGLQAATAREVAAYAGVTAGTIMHHFPTMGTLLAEALRQASEDFTRQTLSDAEQRRDVRGRLYYLVDVNLPDNPASTELWRLWIEVWGQAPLNPELAGVHAERHAAQRAALAAIFAKGVEDGDIAAQDCGTLAAVFLGLLDGLGLQAAVGDPEMPVERARELLHGFVDGVLSRRVQT